MGWVWRDEPDDGDSSIRDRSDLQISKPYSGGGDRCSTRRIVKSQCRTEEVEPGKFIRKCEKTEELLKDCVGRPVEVVQSNKEYIEEDVTDQVLKGSSALGLPEHGSFDLPGLRSDIEAIERDLFGGINRFIEAAEGMTNGFFKVFGNPHLSDGEPSTLPSIRRGIPIEGHPPREVPPKPNQPDSGEIDLLKLAKDV